MQSLYPLTEEMRALGIKRLSIELSDAPPAPTSLLDELRDRETETPPPPGPEKGPGMCRQPGCSNKNGGVLGAAPEYCERHALEQAGVR